jgi:NADPH:quinone reductase-like Zn-dependent oxidoreductase
MQPWIEQGKLHPEIGHTLPMEQTGEAHRLLLQRANYGKIVVMISN